MSQRTLVGPWIACVLYLLATAALADPFTIVALPDTQHYSELWPQIFVSQTRWIADHAADRNIVFVTHLGDIVDDANKCGQWRAATHAMWLLDGKLPYSVCIGNHDVDERRLCDRHFGPTRYEGRLWYGGHSPSGRSHWQRFMGDGRAYLHLNLEVDAKADTPDDSIAWANQVLAANPGVPTILSTHNYLGRAGRTPNGEKIWQRLVRPNPQVFMTLNGHIHGEASQVSANDAGGKVIEVLTDYQDDENGGNGFMRLIRFDPDRGRIGVTSYSPTLALHHSGETSNLHFAADFGPSGLVLVKGVEGQKSTIAPGILAVAGR